MGELFAEIGDIVFTLVIGYISAIEFLYVVRHLYHYSCNHDANEGGGDSAENLSQLQDSMSQQLVNAKNKEDAAGTQVMKDGVPYKDGYRLEAQQALIDQLKEQLKDKALSDLRRQELEKELAKQKKIAEQLRKELAEAEAKYQRQLKQEEEAKAKEEKKEAEEQAHKLAEAEKQREAEQKKREEEEKERIKKEAEQKEKERIQREEQQRKEAEEQARKLAEAEKQREAEQRKREEEEKERTRKEAEQKEKERIQREEQQRKEDEEQARKFAEAEKQREVDQRKREEGERIRKETEEKENERIQREEQQRKEAAEEEARKLAEAEKQKEIEQRQREEAEENVRRLQEAEKQREIEQRRLEEEARKEQEKAEAEENTRRLLEIEKANEEKQAAEEAAAELATKKLLELEHRLEEQLRAAEKEAELTEKERQLIESIKKRELNPEDGNEHKEAELLRKILEAREQLGEESEEEQSLRLIQRERDQEAKQRRIEENALLFMEAEKEMAELQSKMLDAVEKRVFSGSLDSAPQTPIIEEPCIKRNFSPLSGGESGGHSTVKTQLAQDLDEPYSVRTKPLLFPGVSDDASSIDPVSSQKSSFSTQPSEEITTGTDSQYPALERQEPDGEDTNLGNLQYSDDYLRSLDGIKQRPLVREDGSGRRRAFKKRRSSNSSNSSRESRHSRDEELKMFTSLEEEEMKDTADSEYKPIRYTTEPTLKVKSHHRRHKRSPAKDVRRGDDSSRSSLERLGEETSDPWGEVKPEQYKHTEFWKREKALSIDEEMEFEKPASSEEVAYDTATNMPSASSFEEANQRQNKEALTALQKHSAQKHAQEGKSGDQVAAKEESARSDNTNLQISQTAEKAASSARSSASPRLRRSPHVEETDQSWKETKDNADKSAFSTAQNTPTINVQTPLDFGPWRDEYGLIMEGLSDFYDFTASVNPSRSRSASRNVSPANTAPNTPSPKDVSYQLNLSNKKINEKSSVEIYDDTDDLESNEFKKENIIKFIDSLNGSGEIKTEEEEENNDNLPMENDEVGISNHLQYVADDPSKLTSNEANLIPLVNVIDDATNNDATNLEDNVSTDESAMNTLVSSLRFQRTDSSHSRSKSPLPTPDNLKRSVENRRYKMIKHNEDILEKLIETKLLPELTLAEEPEEQKSSIETTQTTTELNVFADSESSSLMQSLHVDKRRSRSKSPMRLPTAENLSKGLEKRRTKLIERNDEFIKQLEERSQTPESPTIVVEHVYELESASSPQSEEPLSPSEEEECSREKMDLLVQSLRAARSRTKSKSPMRLQEIENFNETLESKTFYGFQHAEYKETTQHVEISNVPTISIVFSEAETEAESTSAKAEDDDNCSREKMDLLIQSLRVARSRSTSRAKTPEPSAITEIQFEAERSRHSRSKSPSRSHSQSPEAAAAAAYRSNTPSRSLSPQPSEEYDNFHVMLNLEGSDNRTLSISTEEQESLQLANRQRQLDEEALEKLRNASQEMELRTLSPLIVDRDELNERLSLDYLAELPLSERAKLLRKSPTTPDYDRTISEEMLDVERIKQEILLKGFKRSTYVGESMDLGSEFEPLRKETAKFQRSRSPSPSVSAIENATAQRNAEEKRKIQDLILQELTTSATSDSSKEFKNTGAIPKTERFSSCEIELTLDNEIEDTKRIREQILNNSFQCSSFVESSEATTEHFEDLRRRNAEFKRSSSASRSPLHESQLEGLPSIEVESSERVFKDKKLEEVSCRQDFSLHLNSDFFDNDRRASDSALIKVPQILVHDPDLDPEEYHHYRRFSLAQEEPPVEQYPGDDYIFIQQVEVRTRSGSRTWLREDFYSENVDEYLTRQEEAKEKSLERDNIVAAAAEEQGGGDDHQVVQPAADDEEEYSNASDDDRQTVVEVDDEIDEDISDFNERGPAEESHHETSECEEAEREMDRYAGREASDWNQVVDVDNMICAENPPNEMLNIEEDEGAVGGLSNSPYDSDSFAIDQIYDEAIKNRKQSGILREYDSILMQTSVNSDIDEQYLLWSKTNEKKSPKNIEFNTQFLHNERKDSEMRYLGDANITARQSARLRCRYGYSPVLQAKCLEEDLQVDMNYKPKREYNWRKNFKLDEDLVKEDKEITLDEICNQERKDDDVQEPREREMKEENKENGEKEQLMMELRKFSLGGESVILFSRSPERSMNSLQQQQYESNEVLDKETLAIEEVKEEKVEKVEKPKKKKTKKKSHKESKAKLEETMNREDEDAYDNQVYSRRSSSLQMDTDSPKRKSRSRRSSKSSVTNEDSLGFFSPRSSVAYNEPIGDIMEEFTDVAKEPARPKKMKKRKKVKESPMANVAESPIENKEAEEFQYILEPLNDTANISAVITPESCNANILSTLSPQNSVCVTPASSIDTEDVNLSMEELSENLKDTSTNQSSSTTDSSPSGNLSRTSSIASAAVQLDTFDILKDASFYPLF